MKNKELAEQIRLKKYQLDRDVINNMNNTKNNNNIYDLTTTNDFKNFNYPDVLVNSSSSTQVATAPIEGSTDPKGVCLREIAEVAPSDYKHIKVDLFSNEVGGDIALKVAVSLNWNAHHGAVVRLGFHQGKVNKKSRIRDFWKAISKQDQWYQNVFEHLIDITNSVRDQHLNVYPRIGKGYRMFGSANRNKGGTIIEPHTACVLWGDYPDEMSCRIFIDDMRPINIDFDSHNLSATQKRSGQIGTYTDGSAKAYVADGPSITERLRIAEQNNGGRS